MTMLLLPSVLNIEALVDLVSSLGLSLIHI